MSTIRILFLGTPEFARAHLQSLLDDDHFEVVGVVSQPDRPAGRKMQLQPSPVKALAVEKNIPVITPEKVNTPEVLEQIQAFKAEAAVVVAFGQILPQKFLDFYPRRVVNVHGSLLPQWRGAAPIQRAVMAGDKVSGVCLQVMVKKLDAGDVIGLYTLPIGENTTAMELHDQMIPLGQKLLNIDFMDYLRGHVAAIAQDESKVTYAEKLDKAESLIDWSWPAEKIHAHIRGMTMGPGTYSIRKGKKLKIITSRILDASSVNGKAGVLSVSSSGGLEVTCGVGRLSLEEVQPESKPKMKSKDYLLGHPVEAGEQLGGSLESK